MSDINGSILVRRECTRGGDSGDNMGLRISSIFVVFISSLIGVMIPLVSSRVKGINCPRWVYFFAKYFGSGVIISTAFIHLLFEAHENLSSLCLPDAFHTFPYAFGIALLGIFGTFLIELVTTYHVNSKFADHQGHSHGPSALADTSVQFTRQNYKINEGEIKPRDEETPSTTTAVVPAEVPNSDKTQPRSSMDSLPLSIPQKKSDEAKLASQLSKIFLLEFGIVFHSIFVGLTVAVSGPEFKTLYPVIVFHQMF